MLGSRQHPSVSWVFRFTDDIRTTRRGKEAHCCLEAAPDKAPSKDAGLKPRPISEVSPSAIVIKSRATVLVVCAGPARTRPGHFLGHEEKKLAIPVSSLAQQTTKLAEKARILTRAAPGGVVGRPALGKIRRFGRLFSIVKKLVHGNFQSPGHFLQCFNSRNGMAVLNARDVTTKQSCPLLDISLREVFILPQGP